MVESIPFNEVIEKASTVALASNRQVKHGKNHKTPSSIKWEVKPKTYTGFFDKHYPTAVICDEIPELKLHLVVIDLDTPKNNEDVSISILRSYAMDMIKETYSNITPSGGVHIYYLSKTKPSANQPRSTHNVNIDYQANIGNRRGKYVVADYRWDPKGEQKELYSKIDESPEDIKIVDNTDDVLNKYLSELEEAGHIKDKKASEIDELIRILKPYATKVGERNNFAYHLGGYFKKEGYSQTATENIIREVFSDDNELKSRLQTVEDTYKKPDEDIKGWTWLEKFLSQPDLDVLSKLTKSNMDHLKQKIDASIRQYKNPGIALVAAYIGQHLMAYTDPYVHKYYLQEEDGTFKEIDDIDIMYFCNKHFGVNKINKKVCVRVFEFFTEPIENDYDLIDFNNGILNTKTQEFHTDKRILTKVPKLKLDLNWNPEAPGLEIEKLINRILVNPEYPEDKDLWLRAVGHAFMGDNRIGKITIVTGPSGTGKSTLTTLLQHIFKTSQIQTSKINDNERFTLYGLVNKDINIDDDINNGLLRGIGSLNTIVTGNGLDIEVKGENRVIHLTNPQIPRLFANGNTLPPVLGEGFERRLLLIHAVNQILYEERNDTLQNDILIGNYDTKGLEWFVYTCISKYWEKMEEPITSQKVEEKMKEEHEFKSYPLKVGVSQLFEDSDNEDDFIPMNDVIKEVKKWCLHNFKIGKISKEHKRPTMKHIKTAIDNASFGHTQHNMDDGYGNIKRVQCYDFIKKTTNFKFYIGESKDIK